MQGFKTACILLMYPANENHASTNFPLKTKNLLLFH